MSFSPLTTSLVTELRASSTIGPAVELGAGDGRFAARLEPLGLGIFAFDRDPRCEGLDLVGDLCELPFRDESCGLVILADVLRHLGGLDRSRTCDEALRVLGVGGRVAVFEDHPVADNPAQGTYREVLALLAEVVPRRGAAQRIEDLTRAFRRRFGEPVTMGTELNEIEVEDPVAPLRWMRAFAPRGGDFGQRLSRLEQEVRTHGMQYGRYCYAVFAREQQEEVR